MATFRGIKFPFGKSDTSFPASEVDAELIKQSIIQIATTSLGERVMRDDFGTRALSFIFENNNIVLSEIMREELGRAISRFEPRAIVESILTERDESTVTITIYFVVVLTQQRESVSLTVPAA